MKFGGKIYLGLAAIAATLLPLTLAAFFAVKKIVYEENELSAQKTESVLLTERLRHVAAAQHALMPIFVLSGDPEPYRRIEQMNGEFYSLLDQLRALDNDPGIEPLLNDIATTFEARRQLDDGGFKLRTKGATLKEVDAYFRTKTGPHTQKMNALLTELSRRTTENREAAKAHVQTVIRRVMQAQIAFSMIGLGFVGLTGWMMIKVTRNKEAGDVEARRISQSRKEVVEVVSHDLKNPLSSIKMSLELAMDQIRECTQPVDPTLKTALEIALRSANSMQRLITDLLDHAKIRSGSLVLERKYCDLAAFVRELLPRFEPLAKERGIRLTATIQDRANGHCDQARLEQVLSNLIGNALKFTPDGGEIRVVVEEAKNGVLISIADTGTGISEDDLLHVFDRFWQKNGKGQREGTGLGLSIAKAIVDAHQGEIWVESQMGKGSTFSLHLPHAWRPAHNEVPGPYMNL